MAGMIYIYLHMMDILSPFHPIYSFLFGCLMNLFNASVIPLFCDQTTRLPAWCMCGRGVMTENHNDTQANIVYLCFVTAVLTKHSRNYCRNIAHPAIFIQWRADSH